MTTKHDPTRQQTRVQKAESAMRARWRKAKAACVAYVENLPRQEVVTNATYRFDVSPELLERTIADLQTLMLDEMGSYWLYDEYVSQAYASGTGMAITTLSAQTPAYVATIDSVLSAPAYQARVGLLRSRIFEQMVGFSDGYGQQLGDLLGRAVLDGLNPLDVAKTIAERFDIDLYRAERIARTEITTAARRGRLDEGDAAAEATGMRVMYMHVSAFANSSRQSHMARHGLLFTSEQCRTWWSIDANSINCYLPGTRVKGRFSAGSKALYRGLVYDIVTSNGRNLSVTPNHPILTPQGLVAAKDIKKGDDLVTYQGEVEDSIRVVDLDDKHVDSRVEEVFSALVEVGHTLDTRVSAVDFHGDAVGMDENISVVLLERELTLTLDSKLDKALDYLALKHSNAQTVKGFGSFSEHFVAIDHTPSSLVCEAGAPVEKLGCKIGNVNLLGLAHVAGSDIITLADSIDNGSTDTVERGNTFDPETVTVEVADFTGTYVNSGVEHINSRYYEGYVYDLEERSGLMVADGIIASNCLCSTIEVFVDNNGDPLAPGLLKRAQQIKVKYDKN